MSITANEVKAKEHGDAVSLYEGVISKVWEYKTGKTEKGFIWSFQNLETKDANGHVVYVKVADRVEISPDFAGHYIRVGSVKDSKGKSKGCEIEVYNNKRSVLVKNKGECFVEVNGSYVPVSVIECKPKENGTTPTNGSGKPPPPPGGQQSTPPAADPGANKPTPPADPNKLPNGNIKAPGHPGYVPPESPTPPVQVVNEADKQIPTNKMVNALPVKDYIIMKQCAVKASGPIIAALINAGGFKDIEGETPQNRKIRFNAFVGNVIDTIYRECKNIEEFIPF
jgi:hypothetical protein